MESRLQSPGEDADVLLRSHVIELIGAAYATNKKIAMYSRDAELSSFAFDIVTSRILYSI